MLWPALLAGLLIQATHVHLGREVLQRGIIFLDLAIAQTAAFGVILAGTFWAVNDGGQQAISATVIAVAAVIIG